MNIQNLALSSIYTRSEGSFSPTCRITVTFRLVLIWPYVSFLVCTCRLIVGAMLVSNRGFVGLEMIIFYV